MSAQEGAPVVNPKDYTRWSGLPKWGNRYVRQMLGKYGKKAFRNYWDSIGDLDRFAPQAIEGIRGAQTQQFMDQIRPGIQRETAATTQGLSGAGTLNSASAIPAYRGIMDRVLGAGVGAQGGNRWASDATLGTQKAGLQGSAGFTGTLGDFLAATSKSYDPTAWMQYSFGNQPGWLADRARSWAPGGFNPAY